jgi:hypothetical protein
VTLLELSECLSPCSHCLRFESSFLLLLGVVLPVRGCHEKTPLVKIDNLVVLDP